MQDKVTQELISGNFYHIFNKGNNNEIIFYKERNYEYFLKKFKEHLKDFLKIYSYCLLPNHFHMLIEVKEEKIKQAGFNKERTISQAFSNFFNSYSKSINKQENRFGNLFNRPFKRKSLKRQQDVTGVICYIHRNPLHHGIVNDYTQYIWSSYSKILDRNKDLIEVNTVIEWFGGVKDFILIHERIAKDYIEQLE
ncbi:MAG: hypothetical protein ABIY50_04980 [Ignavibacteria bacterium]